MLLGADQMRQPRQSPRPVLVGGLFPSGLYTNSTVEGNIGKAVGLRGGNHSDWEQGSESGESGRRSVAGGEPILLLSATANAPGGRARPSIFHAALSSRSCLCHPWEDYRRTRPTWAP